MRKSNEMMQVSRAKRRSLAVVTVLLVVVGATACDNLLNVELPSRLPESALDDPSLAETLVLSAVADFECALANYVPATGMLTDEFIGSTGWIAPTQWDQRRIFRDNGNLGSAGCTALGWGIFSPLSTAYFTARDAIQRITDFPDEDVSDKPDLLGTANAYSAYTLTILGEAFCEVTVELGPIMTPTATFELAETQFGEAITLAEQAGNSEIVNMARVGRARVRLNLGKLSEAAADAGEVPEGFVKEATRSGTAETRWNRVAVDQHENFYLSVDPSFRDLAVEGVEDPRVEVFDAERNGHDGVTPSFLTTKYMSNGDPIPIASWDEAQLIIAEAEGGQQAVDAINRLRMKEDLPTFSSSDPDEIAAQVLEERRRELFAEGHRLNDILRHDLPWQEGATHKGVPYGSTTCLPLPDVERENNPNTAG